MTIEEKIRELRKGHNMSQEHMAESLGVSRQAVSKWETGQSRPDTDNLIGLARLFDVTVDELTSSATRVGLVFDLKGELDSKKKLKWLFIVLLLLFAATFAAALYSRFSGKSEAVVLVLVILSAAFILSVFLPIVITILRYVYGDCRRRGIKPTLYVLISLSVAGLVYYLLRRDFLTQAAHKNP